ncbi:MAG: PD40 domain-containing protein, partial [Bdellovibrionales bacterium]|nr:PD40 domain-containing protein [Bdellovibrionales bacterium]
AIYPDITPDGQEVVYVEGPDQSDLNITYQNLGKKLTQRFHAVQKGMILHPKFTKNGRYIYYSAPGPKAKNTIFYFDRAAEVDRQGQGINDYSLDKAKLLDETEESYFPRPSSDGSFIVYQRNTAGKKEIILFDRIENKKTVLAEGMSPALSFDERLIAYTSKKDGNWNIYVIERSTGVTTQATSDLKDEQAPTFMPDNTLAFASNKYDHYRLFKLVKAEWIAMNQGIQANEEVDFYSPQFSGNTTITQSLKAPFIGNARSSFGTVTHEGKLYMCGGHQGAEHTYPPESFSDMFIVYDAETNAWKELAPRPAKAHGYQLAAFGNYIYAFGGFAYSADHKPKWKSLAQIDRYDITTNKWETIGQLLSPRSSNTAVQIEGKVYLAGGWDSTPKFANDMDGKFSNDIEVFDLKTEKVELANFKLPAPLRRALTGIEHDGKIILVGGLGQGASHFELLNNVTAINPVDGTSHEMTALPFATFAPAAEILNNKLFVFGGMFKTGPMNYEYVSHIYRLDLNHSIWAHTGRCLTETKGFSQVFRLDDKTLGILGGHRYFEGYDSPVATFETLNSP